MFLETPLPVPQVGSMQWLPLPAGVPVGPVRPTMGLSEPMGPVGPSELMGPAAPPLPAVMQSAEAAPPAPGEALQLPHAPGPVTERLLAALLVEGVEQEERG